MWQHITSGAIRAELIRYVKKGKSILANLAWSAYIVWELGGGVVLLRDVRLLRRVVLAGERAACGAAQVFDCKC